MLSALRLICFASPKEEDLDALAETCTTATADTGFRVRNGKKAPVKGKFGHIEADKFAWTFQVSNSELAKILPEKLLPLDQEKRGISFELSKLTLNG